LLKLIALASSTVVQIVPSVAIYIVNLLQFSTSKKKRQLIKGLYRYIGGGTLSETEATWSIMNSYINYYFHSKVEIK